jgi:exo-1,4-beta-D-glucosaminidase
LKKFIPPDKLWPPNDYWYFHAGGNEGGNNTLANITRALDHRYGPSNSAQELAKKAQLAHYEDVRAQYETYAVHWSNRKMVMHWMMNSLWPSFFGHLYDYYFKQGGGYFGAKKALQSKSVIWDYYATGDRSTGHVYAVNFTAEPVHGSVSISFYNLDGTVKYTHTAAVDVPSNSSIDAMSVPRVSGLSSAYFVRCQWIGSEGKPVAENVYWESTTDDDLGGSSNDDQFTTKLDKWADLTSLDHMPAVNIKVASSLTSDHAQQTAIATLINNSNQIAFFVRLELTRGSDGDEILPIVYDDNYITLFPHQSRTITANFQKSELAGATAAFRVEGYNVPKELVPIKTGTH